MGSSMRWCALLSLLLLCACGGSDKKKGSQEPGGEDMGSEDLASDLAADMEEPGDTGQDTGGQDMGGEPDLPLDLDHPPEEVIYDFANACVSLGLDRGQGDPVLWLDSQGEGFVFSAQEQAGAARFFLKASDLGTYLLYDQDRGYVVEGDAGLLRQERLESDIEMISDTYISGAEWHLEFSQRVSQRYQLRSRRSGALLSEQGRGADLVLAPAEGCAQHPEMTLDAEGSIQRTTFEDGTLFGVVDTHSHILSNFGFGGGGIFHGAPFHRLGVEHAMGDCELFHGPEGRADLLTWGFSAQSVPTLDGFLQILGTGRLPEAQHNTDGWPTFSGWPTQHSATHQTQYYRWLERAWMGGLRLVVQHAVSNEILCRLMADTGFQPTRWSCQDMFNIDRQLVEIRRMEAYIDAQAGGPGEGWFRVVESPQEAREVIAQGKLAVVLGIEVPNLFSCYLTPGEDDPVCDQAHIEAQLDHYHDQGVRVLFPVHKYDNAFSPGDGSKGIIELANFIQTGHWSNFVEDCPEVSSAFDNGPVRFGGFNMPREEYLSEAPEGPIELSPTPALDLLPYLDQVQEPPLEGDWCQNGGLTDAGRDLIEGIMRRGMVLELDHLPRRSYLQAFARLQEAGYPAAATHGNIHGGLLYEIGGVSRTGIARCADSEEPGSLTRRFRERRDLTQDAGNYPAEGFGFDLNGLAGVPGPRFGPGANCSTPQEDPVVYPFTSFDGDVTFTQPMMGERAVDFNNEGFIHIGMMPELIEDARRTGSTDEDLEILFRSAEGYLRMWERSMERGQELSE